MNPRTAKNVVALTPGGTITEEMILGYITMFTIPDRPVSAATLSRLWIGNGLPHELIPHTRKSVNAFQVACRSVETRKRSVDSVTNKRTEIEVDPVVETTDKCVYQVTSLVRDKANELIEHPKALRVIFDKNYDTIEWEALSKTAEKSGVADQLGLAIREHFEKNAKKVPAPRIRSAVRALFDSLDATNLRRKSGGVYLVPREGKADLDALHEVLTGLWDEAELNMIPCANDEGTREMVERHFDISVSDELDEMMGEIKQSLTGKRALRSDRMGTLLQRRKELANRHVRYKGIVGDELDTVRTKIELLDEQLEALVLSKGSD